MPHRASGSTSLRAPRAASNREPPEKSTSLRSAVAGSCPASRSRPTRSREAEMEMTRVEYAALYGPTTVDQVRLGDTDLWIEVEQDLTFGGEEAVFGGGKSIRESMAQGMATRADGALDTVITNAIVLDHWGIVRADVGIRDGRIVALGRAGNPDIADGVHPALLIGPSTDVISGEGKILTAGAFDIHVHFLSRSQLIEALSTGTTTVGGGAGRQRLDELRAGQEVDVYVESAGREDLALTGDDIRGRPDEQGRVDTIGDVRVACAPQRDDTTVADANVRAHDSPVVEHDRVGDDSVERAVGTRGHALGHRLADRLAAAEHCLLTPEREVLLDLDP